ncbi:MAG: Fe-S cluster assembly protein IscX [Alphaproteobacteria bacterium]|nr:Fe-S cluster assembly protein IscX [Alphaproteobacteria bacterium]MDE2335993.1 Fe-S cluster assembly protein IscX [Alphaproteobacteria bacterium]
MQRSGRLSWSNQKDIAAALLAVHPAADRLSLSHEGLLDLILALPGFADAAVPPQPECLDHILWTWMRLADSGGGGTREPSRL